MKKLGLLIIVLIVMSTCIILQDNQGYFLSAKRSNSSILKASPSKIVENYWELASNGNPKKAEKLITYCNIQKEPYKGNACVEPDSGQTWAELIYKSNIKFSKVINETIKDQKAIVLIETVNTKGNIYKEQYNLLLTQNGWRIYSFHSAGLYPCEFIDEDCEK